MSIRSLFTTRSLSLAVLFTLCVCTTAAHAPVAVTFTGNVKDSTGEPLVVSDAKLEVPKMFSFSFRKFHSVLFAPLYSLLPIAGSNAPTVGPVAGTTSSYTIHGCAFPLDPPLAPSHSPDGYPIEVVDVSDPPHGTISRPNAHNANYCPDYGYVGEDSFSFTVCVLRPGGPDCGPGFASLNVVNQAPSGAGDTYSIHGGTAIGPFLANDSDPDGDPLTCGDLQHECIQTFPQNGQLFGLPQPDRKFYSPDFLYTGSDSFTYNACDNLGQCTPTTVTLHVNNDPPIALPDAYTIRGDSLIGPLLANDYDPNGDELQPAPDLVTFPQHGTVFGLTQPDRKLFRPQAGYTGTDVFSYSAYDEHQTASIPALVTLYILGKGENNGLSPCNTVVGKPVNVTNGNMYLQQGDYQLPSVGFGINLTRTYNSDSEDIGLFGRGWSTVVDESIIAYDSNLLRFNQADGRAIYFGRPVGSTGAFVSLSGDFRGQVTQTANGFTLILSEGSVRQFNTAGKLLALIDRNGNTTSVTYNGNGLPSSIVDPFGRVLSLATNTNGRATSISDTLGTIATYTYGSSNELLSVTYADTSEFNFSYDGNLRLTGVTDALDNVLESHTYDAQGRAITSAKHGGVEQYTLSYVSDTRTDVTDGLGRVTRFMFDKTQGRNVVTQVEGLCSCGGSQNQSWAYDPQSNITSRTDALGHVTSFTYDASGNPLTVTDPTGTVTYTYNGFGQVLTQTDQMNNVTTLTYDGLGNLQTTTDALNNTFAFTYNTRGQILSVTDARGKVTGFTYDTTGNRTRQTDANSIITFFFYDARSRMTKVRDGLSRSTLFAYDPAGRLNKVTNPDLSFVAYTYDLAGRRTSVTDERGNPTSYAYDSASRLITVTDAANQATGYVYDQMSNLTSATDALSRVTNYEYDDFSRLKKIIYPPANTGGPRLFEMMVYDSEGKVTSRTDTAGRSKSYAYDNAHRLTSTTDAANQTTSVQYDALGRVTSVTDALNQQYQFAYDDLGRQTQITRAGVSMSYVYDAVGNRTQRTDYNGVVTNYVYDNLNRLTTVTYPSRTITYTYDPLNNLTRATNENGSVYISYDNRYRVSSFSDPFFYGISYNYDTAGNRTNLKVNGATYATYTYDSVNRLTNLADGQGLNFTYSYDAANRLTNRTAPNGVTSSFAYDGLNRLTSLKHTAGGTTLSDNLYAYNNANDISSWTTQTAQRTYTYDAVDRLTAVANFELPVENYSYDGVGNRTLSHLSATYGYQSFNKLTSTATATNSYDNNGNLISRTDASGTTTFTFNEENELTQVALPTGVTVNYKTDGLGRRIQRTSTAGANERYVFDGADTLIDLNADWSVATTYLNDRGIDSHLRQTSATSGVSYFLADHLGSTVGLTDISGSLREQPAYDSFGNSAGSAFSRYGYTGRERDPDTGMLYYRARSYDPGVGRFISEDPIGLSGGINQFAYVGNSPTRYTDPWGLYERDVHHDLTLYLARKTGCFADWFSRELAFYTQNVDDDPRTSPGPGWELVWPGPLGYFDWRDPDYRQQQINMDYHALHPGSHDPYFNMHWQRATDARRSIQDRAQQAGYYFHYYQDTYSHQTFDNPNHGHLFSPGHYADKTANFVKKSMQMAEGTWAQLIRLALALGCKCNPRWTDADWDRVRRFNEASGGSWEFDISEEDRERKRRILFD